MKVTAVWLSLLSSGVAFAEGQPAAPGGMTPLLPLVFIFGIFYFLIIRPQQRKAKEHQKFLTEMKRGDIVVTGFGVIGTIRSLGDKFATIEVDDGVCLKVLRNQIAENANNLNKEEAKAKPGLFAQTQEDKK